MKTLISKRHLLKSLSAMLFINTLIHAQNIPNSSTSNTGTATAYLPANFTAGIKVNSVRSITPTVPVPDEASISLTIPTKSRVTTMYSDGLGRIIQTINHFGSALQSDAVMINKYDDLGRESYHFLPYSKVETSNNGKFKLTAYSDQKNFYRVALNYMTDSYFYTKTNFESSPLSRVTKQSEQGNNWVGRDRGKTVTENALVANANIRVFTIAYAPGSLPVTTSVYNTGELKVKTTTDEDGFFVEEYTNKEDQLVLKTISKTGNAVKLQTYYVYDYTGLLRYVIPPKAVSQLSVNGWIMNSIIGAELCYSYEYDYRSRPIVKNKAGAGADWYVYNQKDELVFSQTPLQRAKGEWVFIKRDRLGRVIQSGIYNSTANQATMHSYVNTPYTGPDPLLQYMNNPNIYGNATYVTSFTTGKVYVTNYYDDYSFTTRTYDASYMSNLPTTSAWNSTQSLETTNLVTGSKVIVLDGAATPTELLTVNFYNDRGGLLQAQVQNHKGGWNFITNCYDFMGQKLGSYAELNNPQAVDNAKIRMLETYIYDHSGRLMRIDHSLNGMPAVSIAKNSYDEIDRLYSKGFSSVSTPAMVYEYNVRNWLTDINKNYCLNGTGSETFGMELSYDYGYTTNYNNGTIAGMKWRNSGKGTELRSYGYSYDNYNRLKSGDFVFKTGAITSTSTWSNATKDYTASNMVYDENGNLQSMKQMGLNSTGQKIVLDDLQYTYRSNSNKLVSVGELSSSQSINPTTYDNLGDFRDVAGTVDYTYDASGNILSDANKSLSFTYDEILNKTKRLTKGSQNVDYLYDALGNKLQKKVSGGAATTTTDYLGTAVYINNGLSFIAHAEGRIRYNGANPTQYMYDFYLKDHLGNTRSIVTYTSGSINGFAKSDEPSKNTVNYIATSEPDNSAKENQLFDNIDNTRSLKPANRTPGDNYVSKISSNSSKTILGPDITVKVMAGDTVKISAEALVIQEKNNINAVAENVVNNFIAAFTSMPVKLTEGINTVANSNMQGLASSILNMQNQNAKKGAPKAFLNYLLYDEYMNLVPGGSGALQVKNKDGWQTLETDKIAIPQNGFLRVFSSNTDQTPVSINNTTLALITGQLVEEYNYYPYGLVFDATQASPTIKKTDYLYNGKELQHNEFGAGNGLELTDYGARLYDSQIGRWTATDPLADRYAPITSYGYALNNPMSVVDLDGRESSAAGGPLGTNAIAKEDDGWYIDSDGNAVFNKDINDQEDLNRAGIDGTFLGAEGTIVDPSDNTVKYGNSDGTITDIMLHTVVIRPSGAKGYTFDRFIDDTEMTADGWGAIAGGADRILKNRGAYMPRGAIYKTNIDITIRTPLVNINTTSRALKYAKVGGKVLAVINVAATLYEIGQDVNEGKYKSATARAAVAGIAMGVATIPVFGWGVALGIGVADYMWGDKFYNWVETQ
jgi:RHS repeat-associated protein